MEADSKKVRPRINRVSNLEEAVIKKDSSQNQHHESFYKEKQREQKSLLKIMLKNISSGSASDITREKLLSSKVKEKLLKERDVFDRKVSNKRSSKKKEESRGEIKTTPFIASETRHHNKSNEPKPVPIGGRSNSIDTNKKVKEKRKRSSEYSTSFAMNASGKNIVRNISDHFSQVKATKTQPSFQNSSKLKALGLIHK